MGLWDFLQNFLDNVEFFIGLDYREKLGLKIFLDLEDKIWFG
jgi:hypothetical protein